MADEKERVGKDKPTGDKKGEAERPTTFRTEAVRELLPLKRGSGPRVVRPKKK